MRGESYGVISKGGLATALVLALLATMGWSANDALASDSGRIAAGGGHTCAIKADDTVACWGGVGETCRTRLDETVVCWSNVVPAGLGPVDQVAAGDEHTCAIKTDGTPVCWGSDFHGQGALPAGIGTVTQIAAGFWHTCAVRTDGTPICWGDDREGQGTVPAGIGTVNRITAGYDHTCAVRTDGTPICWGDDTYGQSTVPAGIGAVTQISAGETHTCALKTDGAPVCWGLDDFDQVTVPTGIGTVARIAAGGYQSCAIKTNDIPVCWGRVAPQGPRPSLPTDTGPVTDITAGQWHSCALEANGSPICWGSHIATQLGGPPIIASPPPPSLVGVGPLEHTYIVGPPFGTPFRANLPVRLFVSDGALPPGVTLDGTTGELSGTPTADGTYSGEVTVTNDLFLPDGTQPFSITVDTVAPDAPSDFASTPASPSSSLKPRIVGTAETGSTVRLYDNDACTGTPRKTGTAAAFASPGLQINVPADSTTDIYATATDGAGNASACSTDNATYVNAEDPPVDPDSPRPTDPGTGLPIDPDAGTGGRLRPVPKPARPCVVPKLAGKTLARAKKALKRAGCKLGKVRKARRPKGKRRRVLVVKRSSPWRGAKPADRRVDLKLAPRPRGRAASARAGSH